MIHGLKATHVPNKNKNENIIAKINTGTKRPLDSSKQTINFVEIITRKKKEKEKLKTHKHPENNYNTQASATFITAIKR